LKKKFLTLLIFIQSFSILVAAQITWEKRYYDTDNNAFFLYTGYVNQRYDSNLKEFTFLGESHGGYSSIYKLDSSGNVFLRKNYSSPVGSTKNLIFLNNGDILIASVEPYSNYVVKTLFRTDSLFNILWKYQYDIPLSTAYCGLTATSQGRLIMVGMAHYNPYVRPFLIKMDSSGNPILTKYYSDLFAHPRKIIENKDDRFLMAANGYLNDGAIVTKLDSDGQVIWAKSYLKPDGFISDMIEKNNGNILLIGSTGVTTQTLSSKMFIMELDSLGNTLWTKVYGDSSFNFVFYPVSFAYSLPMRIAVTSDHHLIITGSIRVGNSNYEEMILMKTDSMGNVMWERRRGIPNEYTVGINVIELPDGEYFWIGTFNDADAVNPKLGYNFIRTDSLGLVGCDDLSDPIPTINLLPTDSSFTVTDSTLIINQNIAFLYDTILPMPDSVPACIVDAVSEHEQNELQLIAYPNPTTNIFHLHFSDGNSEEKNIFIYDLVGKEISSATHTFKIDFDFTLEAEGIYLVKVFSRGKSQVIKVVVI
jgi:hypothetical protein